MNIRKSRLIQRVTTSDGHYENLKSQSTFSVPPSKQLALNIDLLISLTLDVFRLLGCFSRNSLPSVADKIAIFVEKSAAASCLCRCMAALGISLSL